MDSVKCRYGILLIFCCFQDSSIDDDVIFASIEGNQLCSQHLSENYVTERHRRSRQVYRGGGRKKVADSKENVRSGLNQKRVGCSSNQGTNNNYNELAESWLKGKSFSEFDNYELYVSKEKPQRDISSQEFSSVTENIKNIVPKERHFTRNSKRVSVGNPQSVQHLHTRCNENGRERNTLQSLASFQFVGQTNQNANACTCNHDSNKESNQSFNIFGHTSTDLEQYSKTQGNEGRCNFRNKCPTKCIQTGSVKQLYETKDTKHSGMQHKHLSVEQVCVDTSTPATHRIKRANKHNSFTQFGLSPVLFQDQDEESSYNIFLESPNIDDPSQRVMQRLECLPVVDNSMVQARSQQHYSLVAQKKCTQVSRSSENQDAFKMKSSLCNSSAQLDSDQGSMIKRNLRVEGKQPLTIQNKIRPNKDSGEEHLKNILQGSESISDNIIESLKCLHVSAQKSLDSSTKCQKPHSRYFTRSLKLQNSTICTCSIDINSAMSENIGFDASDRLFEDKSSCTQGTHSSADSDSESSRYMYSQLSRVIEEVSNTASSCQHQLTENTTDSSGLTADSLNVTRYMLNSNADIASYSGVLSNVSLDSCSRHDSQSLDRYHRASISYYYNKEAEEESSSKSQDSLSSADVVTEDINSKMLPTGLDQVKSQTHFLICTYFKEKCYNLSNT